MQAIQKKQTVQKRVSRVNDQTLQGFDQRTRNLSPCSMDRKLTKILHNVSAENSVNFTSLFNRTVATVNHIFPHGLLNFMHI